MDISEKLKAARMAAGKTQEQVALEAGMNITQYNAYERGRSRPASSTLERIARALNTSAANLENVVAPSANSSLPMPRSDDFDTVRSNFIAEVAAIFNIARDRISVRVELN